MKKIKVFLGGYVNYLNAQNINCRALSEHLDKRKFNVATMLYPVQNAADFVRLDDVKYIKQIRPLKWLVWFGYMRGILWADVAYLPKGEVDGFCRTVAKLFGTKVFTTIESVMDDIILSKYDDKQKPIRRFKKYQDRLYSITRYIVHRELQVNDIHCNETILYLGVDTNRFVHPHVQHDSLENIVFIGNDPIRKNLVEYLEVAKLFPSISFNIAGGNQLKECTLEEYIEKEGLRNVIYHGSLDHTKLSMLLKSMDLMFFPSRSEGFPKVMLETACAGVPTLCYNDYGADEWISSGKDGYVVHTKEDAISIIRDLKAHPEKLQQLSRNAVELGKRFDWSVLVKQWENVIQTIYNE